MTSVTVLRRVVSGTDKYGQPIYTTTSVPSDGWVVWPAGASSERDQGQGLTTETLSALAPSGTDVSSVYQVSIDGRTYEIQGKPWIWESPFSGKSPGIELTLKAVTG